MPTNQAKFPFDWEKGNTATFEKHVVEYDNWHRDEPVTGKLPVATGIHSISPTLAEELLRRNAKGANRKAAWSTVQYYGRQMEVNEWKLTGEAIIFNDKGVLIDGQHRLWAAQLSGSTITSMIVTDIPSQENLFAYIDNGRSRSPSVALQTSGIPDNLAHLVASIIAMSAEFPYYTTNEVQRHPRMTPSECLRMVSEHPNAIRSAEFTQTTWQAAVELTGYEDVIGFVGMKIMDKFGDELAHEFFADIAKEIEPCFIAEQLYKVLDADKKRKLTAFKETLKKASERKPVKRPLRKHHLLGYIISAFNMWHTGNHDKTWGMEANDEFPTFSEAKPLAAE